MSVSVQRLGYGMDERRIVVRFPTGARDFSLLHSVQNSSGAQPLYYPAYKEGKAVRASSWHLLPWLTMRGTRSPTLHTFSWRGVFIKGRNNFTYSPKFNNCQHVITECLDSSGIMNLKGLGKKLKWTNRGISEICLERLRKTTKSSG
jgi:hypothetical protein